MTRQNYDWDEAEDHALKRVWPQGHALKFISLHYLSRRSPGAIRARARALGLPTVEEVRERYGTAAWREVETVLSTQGPMTHKQIAAATGLSWQNVRTLLRTNDEHVEAFAKLNGENLYRLNKRKDAPPPMFE